MGRNIEIAHQIDGCCRLFETVVVCGVTIFRKCLFSLVKIACAVPSRLRP